MLKNIYIFLLLISVSFISVFCSFDIQDRFINSSCYESFSSPKVKFKLYHNNPTGPRFLLIELIIMYFSKSEDLLKTVRKNYELKPVYGLCISSFEISLMDKKFSKIFINGYAYLYYNEPAIATFMYHIYNNFTPVPLKLVSTKNSFALLVKFLGSSININTKYGANSKEVKSYLFSIPKDDSICVITNNNLQLILNPKYLSTKPYGIITRVRVEYIKNGKIIGFDYYPAFGCQNNRIKDVERIFLVKDGDEFDIGIKVFYRKSHTFELETQVSEIAVLNGNWVNLDEMEYLLENSKKFFLIKSHTDLQKCKDNKTYEISISESGKKIYGRKFKIVESSLGVKRVKWSFHLPNEICPKENKNIA